MAFLWPTPHVHLVIEPGLASSSVNLNSSHLHKAASKLKVNQSIQKHLRSTNSLAGTRVEIMAGMIVFLGAAPVYRLFAAESKG